MDVGDRTGLFGEPWRSSRLLTADIVMAVMMTYRHSVSSVRSTYTQRENAPVRGG